MFVYLVVNFECFSRLLILVSYFLQVHKSFTLFLIILNNVIQRAKINLSKFQLFNYYLYKWKQHIVSNKKRRHTIQMTNDTVYIVIDQW